MSRRFWSNMFRGSATVLLGCVVAIVGFSQFGLPVWVYWLAIAAAVPCMIAAIHLRSPDRQEAVDEAAWLAADGKRRSGRAWSLLDDVDD